eukprot:TRINITY_DN8354_c0_g2_i3.p1 TRINITY_DN8354_c0_g2~~TRINITY_DN8354_c0_g2_i3.p1  ORF type:complete len:386 (-),score=29.09 TRINITY_DN8354_c0_g2_i3:196-1353(-)
MMDKINNLSQTQLKTDLDSTETELELETVDDEYDIQGNNSFSTKPNSQILPGYIFSEDDSITKKLSSQEFDIEIFRSTDKKLNTSGKFDEPSAKSKTIKFLGGEFIIEILQERNKNPVLVLQCVFGSALFYALSFFITFSFGLNFQILPTAITAAASFVNFWVIFDVQQLSIKNGLKKSPTLILRILFHVLCLIGLFVYAIVIKTPFNSTPLFLLAIYFAFFCRGFCFGVLLTPNFTPFDDPNYQLRFFSDRITDTFFTATGTVDVLSDIAMAQFLIWQYYQSKFLLVIGIFLLVLCAVDYVLLLKRVLHPSRNGLKVMIATVGTEILILGLTLVVLIKFSSNQAFEIDSDSLFVTVISLSSTVVNLIHHVLIIYSLFLAKDQNT